MQKVVIDCETGEETLVDLTEDEIAQRESDAADAAAADEARAARAAQRDRLDALRATGWANLTATEKTEAQGLMLELA